VLDSYQCQGQMQLSKGVTLLTWAKMYCILKLLKIILNMLFSINCSAETFNKLNNNSKLTNLLQI